MTGRLPDFVIIGAQKAGTTWLGARLAEQGRVFMSRPLEVHFFNRDDNYAKGAAWYSPHFAGAPEGALVGEKTPDYLWTLRPDGRGPTDIPARMHALLPEGRLIVVLRDPVKRAVSALNHFVRARWLSPFVDPDAVFTEALDPARDRYGLVGRGEYFPQLEQFLKFYRRDQILVVLFEDDIKKNPQATLDRVMDFLGGTAGPLQSRARPENKRMNSRLGQVLNYYLPRLSPVISAVDRALPEAPPLRPSDACRARLAAHFAPHNRALFAFLGRDTDSWSEN